eukprot:TRINITY_DN6495_c0_g1_i1.p1 TRINITY_DN6495_c0_g1~~TRINITY_DN6495_c0_g1_i1.p1  ORF type:complete len:568 (+),score=130.25 TRINITY_DN6495_c0_g1_i1:41-1744(+)
MGSLNLNMGKHKDKDRSRSRSRKKKHHRSRSRSRDRKRDSERNRESERTRDSDRNRDRGEVDTFQPRPRRQTKWSDNPVTTEGGQPQDGNGLNLNDPNVVQGAININTSGTGEGSLKMSQKELFENKLHKARLMGLSARQNAAALSPEELPEEKEQPPVSVQVVNVTNTNASYAAFPGMNPHVLASLNDPLKIKRKIYIPTDRNFNYAGVIIGPRGSNQKRLEEETGCKILIRGRGSQKDSIDDNDDPEPLHVLIIGDSEYHVSKAVEEIERIILTDPAVLNEIRQEQLKMVAKIRNDPDVIDENQRVSVPSDCIGLVIGKGGETIKMLQTESQAKRVQVAPEDPKDNGMRYIYVEGDEEAFLKVKAMIERIVEGHQRQRIATTGRLPNNQLAAKKELTVPDSLVGLIIGKGGANIKEIMSRTGAIISIPPNAVPGLPDRLVTITGYPDHVEAARIEIEKIVQMGHRNQMLKMMNPAMLSQMLAMNMAMMGNFDPYGGQMADPTMQQQMDPQAMDPSTMAYYMQLYGGMQQAAAPQLDPNMLNMMLGMAAPGNMTFPNQGAPGAPPQ